MIRSKDVNYAEGLIKSITHALNNIKNNVDKYGDESVSRTEAFYLAEKIGNLYNLHFDKEHINSNNKPD